VIGQHERKGKGEGTHSQFALSQLCDLHLHDPEPAVSCRHSPVMWAVCHTSPSHSDISKYWTVRV